MTTLISLTARDILTKLSNRDTIATVAELGITQEQVQQLVRDGWLERFTKGCYRATARGLAMIGNQGR